MSLVSSFSEERARAKSRSTSYGFLAWLFMEGPDEVFIEQMRVNGSVLSPGSAGAGDGLSHSILAGLGNVVAYLAEQAEKPTSQLCVDLAVQKTRLFRGVAPGYGPLPPYEAVYRCPQAGTQSEVMLSVSGFYREVAAQLPDGCVERLDYLGLELDLMRLLCAEESQAWDEGDIGRAGRWRRLQGRFLHEHLMDWVPRFCDGILEQPGARFYHGVAEILGGFLAEEASAFE